METITDKRFKKRRGGSMNPIVFYDYEGFLAKFKENPKTTDECWTPKDVYEAVLKYVGEIYSLEGKQILRPFYPGGDYEHAEYPSDGVVVDNPPFSMFTRICRFYMEHNIPFFLFGPALTIFSCCKHGSTAVVIGRRIRFTNGADVPCNFASNLFGNILATTAPRLDELIEMCPSQDVKVGLPKYNYPDNLLSVSDLQTITRGGVTFQVERDSCVQIRRLAYMPKGKGLFGDHFLLSSAKAKAKAKAEAENCIPVPLSPAELDIISKLDSKDIKR